jgi:cell division protein FtsB
MDVHIKSIHATNAVLVAENEKIKQKNKELRAQRMNDEWLLHSYQVNRVEWQRQLQALENQQSSATAACNILSGMLLHCALPWFISHKICAGRCAAIRTKQSEDKAKIATLVNQFRDLFAEMEVKESELANMQNGYGILSSEPL